MNIHVELDDSTICDGCPLLDTPSLWRGKLAMPPECKMGYKPRWRKAEAKEALMPTQEYVVIRALGYIEVNGE